jgi:hypothetical protein
VFLVMVLSLPLLSQTENVISSPVTSQKDTITPDSILRLKKISKDAIDKQVIYSAPGGYIYNDMVNRRAYIVHNGIVDYGDIEIKADSIIFDMSNNHVYAVGIRDSTGKVVGKPEFKSGTEKFNSDTLEYNFKTKKAVVKNIITQQDEGLLHSAVTKLLEDGTSNIFRSTYSTCDADTPHFYIKLKKAKVYPGKKIISGPGNLVLEGIPLPLYLPFGYFPIQTKKAVSGIIVPKAHYEATRGYALTDAGYYLALNNNFDLTLMGNIFANGSWLLSARTTYNKLYKFNGNFAFSYSDNISGHQGLPDFVDSKNYSIIWSYNQSAKARPGSRFSASVNMSSTAFDQNNSYSLTDHITTTRQSSISYSKTWDAAIPINLSISANHSQNVKNKTVSVDLPKASFSISRLYPFRGKNSSGSKKWYQDLQFQYSASLDNQVSTYDSLLFTNKIWNKMKNGFTHEAPLSFQLRPFKNFSISPSISYKGVLYTEKQIRTWNPDKNKVDTTFMRGAFYGQAINPSMSAGYSPQIFGTFDVLNHKSRIQTIRHVMKPSISFGFTPYISGLSSKMYRQVQVRADSLMNTYSIYDGGIYGTPSLSQRSGNISLNLGNIVQAKVFARNDTTGKPKTINLIDNFNFGTSYNIFADSMRWSPMSMTFLTTLFGNVGLNANASFNFYGMDSNGKTIGTFYYAQTKKLMRLTSFSASTSFSLDKILQGGKNKKKPLPAPVKQSVSPTNVSGLTEEPKPGQQPKQEQAQYDEYGYMIFDSPWTMNVSYSFTYSNPGLSTRRIISQSLSVNGTLQLTKKMSITYQTGYDIGHKAITMSNIQITRDLHCWDMSFSWVPNGNMKMWEFSIRVKASVLQDLKYDRRKDFHDNY